MRPTRGSSRGTGGSPVPPARPCSRWGLPAARVTPGAGALLPHRFTLACDRRAGPSAVFSLLPDPTGHPVLALASTLPCGAPTFLDPVAPDRGHPADSPTQLYGPLLEPM